MCRCSAITSLQTNRGSVPRDGKTVRRRAVRKTKASGQFARPEALRRRQAIFGDFPRRSAVEGFSHRLDEEREDHPHRPEPGRQDDSKGTDGAARIESAVQQGLSGPQRQEQGSGPAAEDALRDRKSVV